LVLFSCRLFSRAQLSTWSISLHRVSAQLAGTMVVVVKYLKRVMFQWVEATYVLCVTPHSIDNLIVGHLAHRL